MRITGKILTELPVASGSGKFGNWSRKDIIIEQKNKYRTKLCLCIWDKALQSGTFLIGQEADFEIEVESRSYNGSWFTQVILKNYKLLNVKPAYKYEVDVEENYEQKKYSHQDMIDIAFEGDADWLWNID